MNIGQIIKVNDRMQTGYCYELTAPLGQSFWPAFAPFFTPQEMLEMGVFEGKYCNDCDEEFPEQWFANAKLCESPNPDINYFGVKSRQSLSI